MVSNRTKVIAHDLIAISLAWFIAMAARFNLEIPPPTYLKAGLAAFPWVLILQAGIARYFGLYKGLWRFASLPDLWNIIRASLLGAVSIALTLFVVSRLEGIPRTTLVLYPLFLVIFLGGPRLTYRLWKDRALSLKTISSGRRVMIVGAGQGGERVGREMLRNADYVPVGFVDDNRQLTKRRIHEIPVMGVISELPPLVDRFEIDLIVIATPSATNRQMQRIVDLCERSGRPFRTLPSSHLDGSRVKGLRDLREVAIEDLLSRQQVEPDWNLIQPRIAGKSVLVTGGAGSIGSELCRQIAMIGVAHVYVLDQNEFGLYQIERELAQTHRHLKVTCILGDVGDATRVREVLDQCRPNLVLHAAAYKHVPILENHVAEAIRNNIVGTYNLAISAADVGCDEFVLISTDKAVRPTSIMGATKRVAEMICVAQSRSSETKFITVRFGNVLDSAGSVAPLFRQQIANGGPVTVTHKDATRYFMSIPEAAQLILLAAAVGDGGEIFVLDMGEPIRITYLAEQMIRLSGQVPGRDIEIVYLGLRPGEKLTEELFHSGENIETTKHAKLLLAGHHVPSPEYIDKLCAELTRRLNDNDDDRLKDFLMSAVNDSDQKNSLEQVIPFERN